MKFKQDYVITVKADKNDVPYWLVTHKGICRMMDLDDYQTILSMLDTVRENIQYAINSLNKK